MTVQREEVTFRGSGGDGVSAELWTPGGEDAPAICLVHEVYGLDAHIRDVGARFAEEGFCVLAPDLYSREGTPGPRSTPEDPAPSWDLETIRRAVRGLSDRRALADLDAAAALLAEREEVDAERVCVLGFCMGGTLAFLAGCTSTRFAGVVDFYGRIFYPELSEAKPTQPLELALNLDRPFLAFFGGKDEGIPPSDVEHMRETLDAAMKSFEIRVFDEAGHGFFNDRRAGFDAQAAAEAWEHTLRFLREL